MATRKRKLWYFHNTGHDFAKNKYPGLDQSGAVQLFRENWKPADFRLADYTYTDAKRNFLQGYKQGSRGRNPVGRGWTKAKAVRIRRNARGVATHIDIRR